MAGLWSLLATSSGCSDSVETLAPPAGASAPECTPVDPTSGELLGAYEIRTQAELDRLSGCEIIHGSLEIAFPDPDLRALRSLREIDGELVFGGLQSSNRPVPASLDRLEQLERIGRGLSLLNVHVRTLAPLAGLRSLGADIDPDHPYAHALWIGGCRALESLEPLAGLTTPLVSLSLAHNGLLTSLAGPPFAERMGHVYLLEVESHVDLSALAGVRELGSLHLDRTFLPNLDFLASLERAGTIELEQNSLLEDIGGLAGLRSVGSLSVTRNAALRRLPAFPKLESLGALDITNSDALELIEGFPALTALPATGTGKLTISDNAGLVAVLGLDALQTAHTIDIARNPRLQQVELAGLRHTTVLRLHSNPELPAASLPFLDQVTAADTSKVAGNAGEPTELDPCPFVDDGVCDAPPRDTLCAVATDQTDCRGIDPTQ